MLKRKVICHERCLCGTSGSALILVVRKKRADASNCTGYPNKFQLKNGLTMYLNFHTEHQISIIFTYKNRPNLRNLTFLSFGTRIRTCLDTLYVMARIVTFMSLRNAFLVILAWNFVPTKCFYDFIIMHSSKDNSQVYQSQLYLL